MLKTMFVLRAHYNVIIYARYSDENQNPRSIDQQIDTIHRETKRQNLPWTVVATYSDSGISGRKKRQRKGFMKMMQDIRSGAVVANLVLVDTFERLSRAEDGLQLRNELARRGLMVLTADSHFVDPTSPAGQALTFVESVRSSEVGKAKAHDILRGKLDAVRLKHWPGGPVPFGLQLKSVMKVVRGAEEVDYKKVIINPDTSWIVEKMFAFAEGGFGTPRIARRLNDDESIPAELKPFNERFVAGVLDNTIYRGILTWNCNCTGLIDDTRILQPNPESEWERIDDFCPAIVSHEVWDRVAALRAARRQKALECRQAIRSNPDSIMPRATGIPLKYVLTGLVHCTHCGRAMAPSSHRHTLKTGEIKTYVNYICPASRDGRCLNNKSIREDWLREIITGLVATRVFFRRSTTSESTPPLGRIDSNDLEANPAYRELKEQVQREFERLSASQPHQSEVVQAKLEDCRKRQNSYLVSLGKSSISGTVRELIEQQLEATCAELNQLEADLQACASISERFSRCLTADQIAAKLNRLSDVLASHNIPAMNLCLAQHIATISCDFQGRVQVKTCKLGALAEIREFLHSKPDHEIGQDAMDDDGVYPGAPQRLSRRDTGTAFELESDALAANEFATDPHRFSGLGPEWFSVDEFELPKRQSWAKENALIVANSRLESPCSLGTLAARFAKTKPTIMDALRFAKNRGVDASTVDARRLQPNWARANAQRVFEFLSTPGATMAAAVKHFQKSDAWLRRAKQMALEIHATGTTSTDPATEVEQSKTPT